MVGGGGAASCETTGSGHSSPGRPSSTHPVTYSATPWLAGFSPQAAGRASCWIRCHPTSTPGPTAPPHPTLRHWSTATHRGGAAAQGLRPAGDQVPVRHLQVLSVRWWHRPWGAHRQGSGRGGARRVGPRALRAGSAQARWGRGQERERAGVGNRQRQGRSLQLTFFLCGSQKCTLV